MKRISRGKKTLSKTFPLHFTVPWSYILKKSYNNDQSKAIASDTDLAIRCTHTDSQSSRVWFPGNCNISSMIFNSIVRSPISNYQYSWLKWKQYGAEEKTCKTFILSYLAQRQNLWEYTGTIKNKHKFRMILFGLSRPFQSLWMSPACGQDYLGLPRLTHAYPSSIGLQINNWCPCSVRQLSAYSKKLFAME